MSNVLQVSGRGGGGGGVGEVEFHNESSISPIKQIS